VGSIATLRAALPAAAFEVLLLIASAAAGELVSPAIDGCTDEITERGRLTKTKVYTSQKISLDFRDADIVNVLRILAEVGGENIVITDDVKGRITLRLVDVPSDQALDIVLLMNRLGSTKVLTWRTALRP
jgi:type IV pilus assembly protein PilQ